ncbi:MAG: S8 family serine peptidase [Planctomycetes bacterium]|nr:S8 family serine peptidase [Planctomycetota bacterium]
MLSPLPLLLLAAAAPVQVSDVQTIRHGNTVAQTWVGANADGEIVSWYRTSLDGGLTFGRDRQTSYEVKLTYRDFNPLADSEPPIPDVLRAPEGHQLYIVQYIAAGLEPWRKEIRELGGVDQRFLAWHGNIWELDAATVKEVAELPFVRWVGKFHPAYKVENELLHDLLNNRLTHDRYRIVVGDWGPVQKAVVADYVRAIGGEVEAMIDEGWILEASLTPNQLLQVIRQSEVLGIDRWSDPETDMDRVRNLMGADYVEGLTGFDGTGVRAEVMDSGFDGGNRAWRYTPINHGGYNSSSHGTSTYSINFADTSGTDRGLAPDAQGIMADYGSYGGNRYAHTAELVNPTLNYKAVYQTNSWGDSRTRSYTSISQQMDDIIFINHIVITQSQSNAGNQDSRPQAWAKNIVSVGGIRHYGDFNNNNDDWNGGASTGPAADGRIKPDMNAFYDSIDCVNTSSFGGTSGATPIVSGHFALFYEMWHNGYFNNPTAATVFDSRPHSTTARAIMMNTAWQYPDTQDDITRTRQGWGRPDLREMYDTSSELFWVDESDVLQQNESSSYTMTVPPNTNQFQATLVYIDRAGTTSSSLHRINDMSLKVTAPDGTIYWGNNGLNGSSYNYSRSSGVSNTKDPVEHVILENPAAGTWKVEVFADEINQDTHTETSELDADYALVVRGATEVSGGFELQVASGTCGRKMRFEVSGETPGGNIAWAYGKPGTYVYNGPSCLGITLNIDNPILASIGKSTSLTTNVPANACGVIRVQAVDVQSCSVSNSIDL